MSNPQGSNDYLAPTAIAVVVLLILGWTVFADQIRGAVWLLLRWEASVVGLYAWALGSELRELYPAWVERLGQPVDPELRPGLVVFALEVGGRFIRWPVALVCGAVALWVLMRSPALRYRRKMTLEQLLHSQARSFPRIRPILHLRDRFTREQRGAYYWPDSPFEWAVRHGVIRGSTAADREQSFDAAAARKALVQQLGRPLRAAGSEAAYDTGCLAWHEELLLAVFAARIMGRKKDADRLLDAAAAGFGPVWSRWERLKRSVAGGIYDWPVNGPWEIALPASAEALMADVLGRVRAPDGADRGGAKVAALLRQHAYSAAALARLLAAAQETGIVTTSDFVWLKAVDRSLHYALNDVGRRVAVPESAGVRAHYQVEVTSGRAEREPKVDEAVRALRISLEESSWMPPPSFDEAEWATLNPTPP